MITDKKVRSEQGERLKRARIDAGYSSARTAALENGWKESTYRAHEGGTRTIGQNDATKYAKRYRQMGARVSAQSILFGDGPATLPLVDETAQEGEYALNEEQARIVRLVFQAFLEHGMSDPELRAHLAEPAYQAGFARIAAEYAQSRKVHALAPPDDEAALAGFRLALAIKLGQ